VTDSLSSCFITKSLGQGTLRVEGVHASATVVNRLTRPEERPRFRTQRSRTDERASTTCRCTPPLGVPRPIRELWALCMSTYARRRDPAHELRRVASERTRSWMVSHTCSTLKYIRLAQRQMRAPGIGSLSGCRSDLKTAACLECVQECTCAATRAAAAAPGDDPPISTLSASPSTTRRATPRWPRYTRFGSSAGDAERGHLEQSGDRHQHDGRQHRLGKYRSRPERNTTIPA